MQKQTKEKTEKHKVDKKHLHKNKNKNLFCINCGKIGHKYKFCRSPIISAGIILYRDRTYNNGRTEKEFLHVCRKDSIGYVDFVRGKYRLSDVKYIKKLLGMMTLNERRKIMTMEFKLLWQDIWFLPTPDYNILVHKHKFEFKKSEKRFSLLQKGYLDNKTREFIVLHEILRKIPQLYKTAEWGFPKGRRSSQETDIECAQREFIEETAIPDSDFKVHTNLHPIVYSFKGQNMRSYRHIFYLAEYIGKKDNISINFDNILQRSEISDIKWFSIYEASMIFRSYNRNKIKSLYKALRLLLPKSSGKKSTCKVVNGKR